MKICLFSGSSLGQHPIYAEQVRALGEQIGKQGWEVIYGGGNAGLMGVLAQSVLDNGGRVTGIIPKKIAENVPSIELSELLIVETMHERKQLMYERSDAFVTLPGGIGTLEELFEIFTWQQIGYHEKPVAVFNINRFFQPLLQMLDHTVNEGFLSSTCLEQLIVEEDMNILFDRLQSFEYQTVNKWAHTKS